MQNYFEEVSFNYYFTATYSDTCLLYTSDAADE